MAKLSRITIYGFRGIRNELQFNLQPHTNALNLVLSGENGKGKSSFVDALEWFFHDTVSHLRREGCQENAYRHYRLPDNEEAFVRIDTTDTTINGDKRLSLVQDANNNPRPRVRWQARGANLDSHLTFSRSENIIIRHAQLKDFINKTKTEKLNAVSSVIGFDVVPQTRDTLTRVKNALTNDQTYLRADGSIAEKVRDIFRITEPIMRLTTDIPSVVFGSAEVMRQHIGGVVEITDLETYRQSLGIIAYEDNTLARQQSLSYRQLHSQTSHLRVDERLIQRYNSFAENVKSLLKKSEILEKLVLSQLYQTGAEILEINPEIKSCPLCGAEIDYQELLDHIRNEVEGFKEISLNQESLKQEGAEVLTDLNATIAVLTQGSSSVAEANLPETEEWMRSCNLVRTLLAKSAKNINDFLTKPSSVISVTDDEVQLIGNYQTETDKLLTEIQELIDGLKETDEESARATTTVNFRSLLEHYERWLSLCEHKQRYDIQIAALDTMIRALEQTERNEFNNVLNHISADVNDFYVCLHPDEGFDQLKLSSTQDRGLEFEFIYQGDPISPPGKLMSESHLNTLGLCFFLASVIHYNHQCEFVVLDDVVSSVDANHRLALARLLRDEPRLNQRQYIILSHDMYWSDLLKRSFPNWVHKKITNWNYDAGISMEDEVSLREQVTLSFAHGDPVDAGHKVRFLAEKIFKDISEYYRIPMPYCQGQGNEKRELSDFIISVQQYFGNNNRFHSNQPPLVDISNSLWLMNIASHPDPRQLNLSMADVQMIYNDLNQFEALFLMHSATCPQAQRRLNWDRRSNNFTPCSACNESI